MAPTTSEPGPGDTPPFEFGDHIIAKVGIHVPSEADECGRGMHLHLDPVVFEADGHIDFGVLGVFLDMASSQAVGFGPFVHADISINRIARPHGDVLHVDATALRSGKRSSIVHVSAFDSNGTIVADSTQQIVGGRLPPGAHTDHQADTDAVRRRFEAVLDGVCRLPGRLHDTAGIVRVAGPDGIPNWSMPSGPLVRNGFGGLHGGVAFDLVTEAASGAIRAELDVPAEAQSAMLRYLAPAVGGPFRAVPTVLPQDGDAVFVRVAVHDDGQDGKLCIIAEVHATLTRG